MSTLIGTLNFSRTDATGTNVDSFIRAIDNCSYFLNVWSPATVTSSMGEGN